MSALLDLVLGPIGAVLGIVVAGLVTFFAGRKSGKAKAEIEKARSYQKTRKEMDDAEDHLDREPDAAREWLRKRGK